MTTPSVEDWSGILDLFEHAVPSEFFDQLQRDLGLSNRQRVFTLQLVVWLMISQRLTPRATLSATVEQMAQGLPNHLRSNHKRVREGAISAHTGAYSDARHAVPVVVAEKVADRVLEHVMKACPDALPGWNRRVFILDGSSLEMPHTPDLVAAYPPHPQSHWPVMRILVAQDLTTGLAQRPCWGPMYGPQAVSEQALTERMLDRMPPHSVFIADINFGVFTVAFAATQRSHEVLVRLQPSRAGVVGRGLALQSGLDQVVCWRPSAHERKRHPQLPANACVWGRLIVQEVVASDGSHVTLYLFTTLTSLVEQLVELYGQRWDVETDLRSLKQTLGLQTLRCRSVDMIAKELLLGIVGYNLVRAVMNAAAAEYGLNPRRLSFSRSQDAVNAAQPGLEASSTPNEYRARLRRMFKHVASCKLPDRSKRASTPRKVWPRARKFPTRKVKQSRSA